MTSTQVKTRLKITPGTLHSVLVLPGKRFEVCTAVKSRCGEDFAASDLSVWQLMILQMCVASSTKSVRYYHTWLPGFPQPNQHRRDARSAREIAGDSPAAGVDRTSCDLSHGDWCVPFTPKNTGLSRAVTALQQVRGFPTSASQSNRHRVRS